MRGPNRPNFYRDVEEAHAREVAPPEEEEAIEQAVGRAMDERPEETIAHIDEVEARLASFEFDQWLKVEDGHITRSEYMARVRQFDNELVIEIEQDEVRSPEVGIHQERSSEIGMLSAAPELDVASFNGELTDEIAARMERLLESSQRDDIELETRLDIPTDFGRTM